MPRGTLSMYSPGSPSEAKLAEQTDRHIAVTHRNMPTRERAHHILPLAGLSMACSPGWRGVCGYWARCAPSPEPLSPGIGSSSKGDSKPHHKPHPRYQLGHTQRPTRIWQIRILPACHGLVGTRRDKMEVDAACACDPPLWPESVLCQHDDEATRGAIIDSWRQPSRS